MKRPECYRPNNNPYPLCRGARNASELIKKDCRNCGLYEDMDEPEDYDKYCYSKNQS